MADVVMTSFPVDDLAGTKNVDLKMASRKQYWDPATVEAPQTLNDLIAALHDVFADDDVCVEYVQKLMTSYTSCTKEWKKFAKFDQHKYTRNLVDEGNGKFNLMILCWNEAQGSSIHSHADSHCFMKVLSGAIKEELFEWPSTTTSTTTTDDSNSNNCNNSSSSCSNGRTEIDGKEEGAMRKVRELSIEKNACAYINDSIGLHRVENDSHVEKAITLHLYSPPFKECQCFDQRSGKVSTSQMTFWSKYGKRTPFGKFPHTPTPAPTTVMEDN